MQPFPPPSPDDAQPVPTPRRSGSRRRVAIAAVAAGALGVGGVVIGAQLVSADDDPTDDSTTTTPADDEPVEDSPSDDPVEAPADDDVTPDDDVADLDDLGDLGDLGTMFDDITSCLSDELPEITDEILGEFDEFPSDGDWDGALDDLLGGSVTVLDPGNDLLSFFGFGEGDGTITITRTDGEIDVTTEGDVDEVEGDLSFEMPDFEIPEFEIPEIDPEVGQAMEDCLPMLGEDGFGDILGDLLDDGDLFGDPSAD